MFFPNLLHMPRFHSVMGVCHKCVRTVWWYAHVVPGMADALAQREEKCCYAEIVF